jgi:hypothetical protein
VKTLDIRNIKSVNVDDQPLLNTKKSQIQNLSLIAGMGRKEDGENAVS